MSKPALSYVSLSNKIGLGAGQCGLKKICEFFIFLIFCYEPNRSNGHIANFGYAATKPITPFLLIREALAAPRAPIAERLRKLRREASPSGLRVMF